jgi:monoamine oxidase
MHALAEDMAGDLGDALRLASPVVAIGCGPDGVDVSTEALTLRTRGALVALPPSMAARLTYVPVLQPRLAQALSAWRSGAVIKLVLRYPHAFWRDRGLSGEVLWRDPPGIYACDTGQPERPTLSAFIGGPLALDWRRRGMDAVRDDVLAQLAAALGDEALRPIDAVVRDWLRDQWSGGAYSDLIMEMDARQAEAVITAGAPPVHFACSEVSPSFPGYIEGAIVAGRRAARTILDGWETRPAT